MSVRKSAYDYGIELSPTAQIQMHTSCRPAFQIEVIATTVAFTGMLYANTI